MLAFVQKWLAPKPSPIGVDFGTDSLRLAQVHFDGTDHQLLAAASAPAPPSIRNDFAARMEFFTNTTRDLLRRGNLKGGRLFWACRRHGRSCGICGCRRWRRRH